MKTTSSGTSAYWPMKARLVDLGGTTWGSPGRLAARVSHSCQAPLGVVVSRTGAAVASDDQVLDVGGAGLR